MKTIISMCTVTVVLLSQFAGFSARAQTSGPRKPPTARTSSPAPTTQTSDRAVVAPTNNPAEVKMLNGLELTLVSVKGSSVGQTVTATFMMKNPGGNTQVCTQSAYAVDMDGNQYESKSGRNCDPLYTDIPLKREEVVKGVPSKVKNLAIFTFNLHNKTTRKWEKMEFRNLQIEWQ